MQLTLLTSDDELERVQCAGQIMQFIMPPGQHPLQKLLGPDIFARRVLFNLEKATFLDSSGVAWLLSCHRRFEDAGGRVVYHSSPPVVDETLRVLLGMDRILHLASNEAEARIRALEATR